MNESFAQQIGQILKSGETDISHTAGIALAQARHQALLRLHHVPVLARFGMGYLALGDLMPQLRMLVMAIALLLGVGTSYTWNQYRAASENAVIDSALLADELPPEAYVDKGFQAWLEHSASNSN